MLYGGKGIETNIYVDPSSHVINFQYIPHVQIPTGTNLSMLGAFMLALALTAHGLSLADDVIPEASNRIFGGFSAGSRDSAVHFAFMGLIQIGGAGKGTKRVHEPL